MDRESLKDEQEWESIKRTDNALVIALGVYANKYHDRDLRDFEGFSDHPDLSVYRVDDERVPGIWNELGRRRPMTPTWFIFSSLLDKEKVLEKAVDAHDDFELFSVIRTAAKKSYDIRVRKPLEGKFPNIQVIYSREDVIDEMLQHRDKIYCVTIFTSESTCSVINELAAAHRNVKFVVRDATWDPQPYSYKLPVTGIHKGSRVSLFDVYGENYGELDAAVEKWKNLSFTYPKNISFDNEPFETALHNSRSGGIWPVVFVSVFTGDETTKKLISYTDEVADQYNKDILVWVGIDADAHPNAGDKWGIKAPAVVFFYKGSLYFYCDAGNYQNLESELKRHSL